MRVGVDIDALRGIARCERDQGASLGLVDEGRAQVRRTFRFQGELCAECSPGTEGRARVHEARAGHIPEGGGAAVTEHDLVALGDAQEGAQPVLEGSDDVSHGRCAVGGAHEEGCEEGLKLVGAHFRGTTTEATVGGQEDRVNVGENHHEHSVTRLGTLFPSCSLIELA